MDLVKDIARAFDRRGCTGLTIWVNIDGHVQVSMCGPDRTSWGVSTHANLEIALDNALEEYLNFYKRVIHRVPKLPRQMLAEKAAFNAERSQTRKRRKRNRGRHKAS